MSSPPRIDSADRPYVTAVVAEGTFVFPSGQRLTKNGELVVERFGQQTDPVFENVAGILASVGSSLADIVRCGVYLADPGDTPEFNAAYVRAFDGKLPARTAVGVELPGYAVGADCTAKVR
jgi:2-iminobutanoate/2-iminopropanoate deaminase